MIGGHAETDHWDPEDAGAVDGEFVLAAGIGQGLHCLEVMHALDLDHSVVRRPFVVDVPGAVRSASARLPIRFRETEIPAEAGEVEFADRLSTG